jgi:hypothetical protein
VNVVGFDPWGVFVDYLQEQSAGVRVQQANGESKRPEGVPIPALAAAGGDR